MATTPTSGNDNITLTSADEDIAALAGNDVVRAGDGNDTVHGDAGNDKLFGEGGHDHLWGDAGNDDMDGGAGTDTAHYTGTQAQYQIATTGGVTEVKDLRGQGSNTPDGIDHLVNVERLAFGDGTFKLLVPDQPPDAVNDTVSTNEDTAIDIGVLTNDTDPDGDALTIASLSDADATKPGNQTTLGATISIVGGQIHYDPTTSAQLQALNDGQSLNDSFTYAVSDGFGGTDTATVAVAVAGRDDALVLPAHYQGVLREGQQGAGQISNGPDGVNGADPTHNDYWAVEVEAGQTVEIRVDRAEGALDPFFWLFEGLKQPSDFDGGFAGPAFIDGADPGFVAIANDELPPAVPEGPFGGPARFGDPYLSFTAAADGVYTVIVASNLSEFPGEDGVYDYNIFVS